MNPDTLRSTDAALEFTRHFFQAGKPAALICHAPLVLRDAGVGPRPRRDFVTGNSN